MPSFSKITLTPYQQHCEKWKDGCGASICSSAHKVCLVRGQIPCHVLLLGEAPGPSENLIGAPFVGPAGQLQDRMIKAALQRRTDIRIAFTNLVGCIPLDDEGKKFAEPDDESIIACQPRLEELINICKPQYVVRIGKLAKEWVESGYRYQLRIRWPGHDTIRLTDIVHPAGILRAPIEQQGLLIQRTIVHLKECFDSIPVKE